MTSKRSHEGVILLDSRDTPGLTDAEVVSQGLPAGAGKGLFEAPTYTCSHCQRVVILNPKRNRERAYCTGCDHYICDDCGVRRAALGGQCKTFKQIMEEAEAAVLKGTEVPSLILPPNV